MPRQARPFLCRRKERAQRFAFLKGEFRFPPYVTVESPYKDAAEGENQGFQFGGAFSLS